MLPIRPTSKSAKARELLEKIGGALLDDDEPDIPPRNPEKETPRERYVRNMETRWAEFYKGEDNEGDALAGLLLPGLIGAFGLGLFAVSRWIIHLSYAQQWKIFSGPALIYVAWVFWSIHKDDKKT